MVLLIRVFIEGEPKAQPRHSGTGPDAYVPKEHPVHNWRQAVAYLAIDAANKLRLRPSAGPVGMRLVFQMRRPKAHGRRDERPELHTQKPDLKNLLWAAEDALQGIPWRDDCQVGAIWAEKRWADGPPGLALEVHALEDSPTRIPRICLSRPG